MRKFLRRLGQDWKLKLLAGVLAVLLWVVVSGKEVTSEWIRLPLQVSVTDPSYELVESSVPDEVEVRFAGAGGDLLDVGLRRPPVRLTISEVSDADEPVPLEPRMVSLPDQIAVEAQDVRPSAVRLQFRRISTRSIPVQTVIGNGLGIEFTLVDTLEVRPAQVEISGPAERVAEFDFIATVPINLSAGDSTFARAVRLDTSAFGGVQLSQTVVRVAGRVDRLVARTIPDVPISVGAGVALRPAEVDVTVRGAESVVGSLTPSDFRVVVAIDAIPSFIPTAGIEVPVGVEGLRPGLVAQPAPRTVRLLPARVPPDTTTTPPPAAADTTGTTG
ncbi:MAG TPA: hypothetical protein VFI91_09565 [Longimicrobiaceae bacterium]|nr:hypothetical protein [Longimicrobiaceae bacterium]